MTKCLLSPNHGLLRKVWMIVLLIVIFSLYGYSDIFSAEKPAVPKSSSPRLGGTLRFAAGGATTSVSNIGFPPTLTAGFAQVAYPAIETLFRCDKTGKLVPWLATGYKDDIENKAITLTLRKGVKFHDGTDFNAEAVKFNLDLATSKKTGGTERFKSVDVVDAYTLRISLTEWDSTVVSSFITPLGMMISPTAYKTNSEEWCITHPVGTGPFKFVSWQKDDRITYEKSNNYWQKGKPYLNRIEIVFIADTVARLFALKKGETDMMQIENMDDIPDLEKAGFVITSGTSGSGCNSLIPDANNPKSPWADVRVRQAAQYALDTEAIGKKLFSRYSAGAINQFAHKGSWAYNPSVTGYPYNPKKAKQLLSEAGYPNGFKTKITYIAGGAPETFAVIAQAYLKAVGIDAEMDGVLNAKWGQIALSGGTWDGLFWGGYTSNPDTTAGLISRYAGGKYYSMMLVPDDYIKAIKNAVAAPNFADKQKYTREAMKLMIDKHSIILPLAYWKVIIAKKRIVRDVGIPEVPNTIQWTPEDAWLEK